MVLTESRTPWLVLAALLAASAWTAHAAEEGREQTAAAQTGGQAEVSLSQLLTEASGVRVATMCTNCNIANVTMLGQTGDHVQIWQDGLPVVGGLGGIYLLSVLPGDGIASTEVIRGPGTVLSGSEAAVGAVVLRTLDPSRRATPLMMASADLGGLGWRSQQLMAFGRQKRYAGGFTFTHAQSGPSDPNRDGNNDLGSFDRTTFAGTGTFAFTKRSHVRADALSYVESQRDNKGGWNSRFDQRGFWQEDIDIRRREGTLAWDLGLDDGSKLTATGRYSARDQATSDNAPGVTQPYLRVEEASAAGEARYERTLFNRHLFTAGLVRRRLKVEGRSVHGGEIDRTDTVNQSGAFAQVELALPARLDVTAGLRWDDYAWGGQGNIAPIPGVSPTTGRTMVLPRVRVAWKATKTLALSLSGGKALAPPKPVFERVCCGQQVLPNDYVRAEFSTNYLLDANWVPWRWFKLDGSLFRNEYSDYLQKLAIFSFNFIPTLGVTNYSPFTLEGAELSFEMRFWNLFSFGAQGTRVRRTDKDPIAVGLLNDTVFQLAGDRMIPFQPEKLGSAFVKLDDAEWGLQISLQAQYTGSMFVQQLPEGFGVCDRFTATPSFWVANFRAEKRLGDRFSAFAGVDNLGDYTQTHLENPRFDYQWGPLRGRYYYGGLSWRL